MEFWYRLGKPKVHSLLSTNRLVIDSLRIYNSQTTNPSKEWSPKFGDGAAIGVKEFITPLNLYANYFMADGQAEGSQVRLFLAKALDERGLCTYTHELTHLLVGTVWLNNNKQREGLEAEFYPRGLFETYELDEPVLNLNLIYDHNGKERFHNSSPERFKTDKDLQEYTSGLFDVLYTLDYAEANVILKKDKSDKQKWFHKLEQINDTRKRFNQGNSKATHKIDSIRKISTDEANELNTIYDLIDKNIITSRYEVEGLKTTGNVPSNGYYVVPLFSSNYAGVQNNNGVSGDVMMRSQAYELIAEYGYYDGLVPYLSNQYKAQADKDGKVLSDEYILGKIFEGKYATMTDFKKAMFNKRIDKKEQLKPVSIVWKNQKVTIDNFNKLNELMTDAIESDLKNVQELPTGWNNIRAQNTQVELLKKEIFKAYLKETDDFNKSIYRNDHKIIKHNKYINGYPDNTFRQENKITRGEMATMLTRIILDGKQVPITENKFNDISNDYWAKNEVNYLASKGLLNGYEDGTFRPENPITRAEVATILVRSNGDIKQKFKKIFPDIDDSHWANKYIEKAAELGYMLGYEDGSFKPDQVITRGETVVTLNRIYRNPCDLKETNNSKILFTDLDKNNWAYNDIVKAILSHEHVEK
nr:ZmpA/ZmpB/ZmpC family metallo-endopeptidase [Paeniclostridium sp.]